MADHVLDVHGHQLSMGLKVDPAAAMQGCHVGGLLTVDRYEVRMSLLDDRFARETKTALSNRRESRPFRLHIVFP